MKKLSFGLLAILVLLSCQSGQKFNVTGEISGADGKKLYLEASRVNGIVPLDSAKLNANGKYSFKQPKPESPEFFRLRIENKVINFSIDSTETVTISAPYDNFTTGYTVLNSPNSDKIKELTLKQIRLQNEVNSLAKSAQASGMRNAVLQDSLASLLNAYKDEVKRNYIYAAPNTSAAYFALFQQVNNFLIFDPLNSKEDVKSFAAVATSMNALYPDAERSKYIYNLVIKGMKNTRPAKEKVLELSEDQLVETGLIDIALKDLKGETHKLTDLKGKVVLLDFTVYQNAVSAAHNFWLRDLYDKYKDKGFEIYQISLDADEHFWKTSADNLPWLCVRDPNGVYSTNVSLYNVRELPAYFLISKKNELKIRNEDIKDIDAEIKALL